MQLLLLLQSACLLLMMLLRGGADLDVAADDDVGVDDDVDLLRNAATGFLTGHDVYIPFTAEEEAPAAASDCCVQYHNPLLPAAENPTLCGFTLGFSHLLQFDMSRIIMNSRGEIQFLPGSIFPLRIWNKANPEPSRLLHFLLDHLDADAPLEEVIVVKAPYFGRIWHDGNFRLEFMRLRDRQDTSVLVNAVGLTQYSVLPGISEIFSFPNHPMAPASWFMTLQPMSEGGVGGGLPVGPPIDFYMEFALTRNDIAKKRYYHPREREATSRLPNQDVVMLAATAAVKVCIWSSDKVDGQASIWLDQIMHIDEQQVIFHWIISPTAEFGNKALGAQSLFDVLDALKRGRKNGLRTFEFSVAPINGLPIDRERLREACDDGQASLYDRMLMEEAQSPSFSDASGKSMRFVFRFISERLIAAKYDLSKVSPLWVHELISLITTRYSTIGCDLITFPMGVQSAADILIADSARVLGVPVVIELMRVDGDPLVVPDVIVGPSHFALSHSSVQRLLVLDLQTRKVNVERFPISAVIQPGVDINLFKPATKEASPLNGTDSHHIEWGWELRPECYTTSSISAAADIVGSVAGAQKRICEYFVVVFLGRLAPEKSPGLFLRAAALLWRSNPDRVRVLVIGDGPLKMPLVNLGMRLGLMQAGALKFAGWLSRDLLPLALSAAGTSVVVNPSQAETFCTANLQVMSMGIPLISFGIDGMSEYVNLGISSSSSSSSRNSHFKSFEAGAVDSDLFTVLDNSIVVNEANPRAIFAALTWLLEATSKSNGSNERASMLSSLAERAREAAVHFAMPKQLQKYVELYKRIARTNQEIKKVKAATYYYD